MFAVKFEIRKIRPEECLHEGRRVGLKDQVSETGVDGQQIENAHVRRVGIEQRHKGAVALGLVARCCCPESIEGGPAGRLIEHPVQYGPALVEKGVSGIVEGGRG